MAWKVRFGVAGNRGRGVRCPLVGADETAANMLTDEKKAGWKLLFDGQTTDAWRNFKRDKVGSGWKVDNGEIQWSRRGAGDIITKDQFAAFELSLEYKISKGGNSGIMFHVTETEATPWMTGPEIQLQDNKDGHDPQKSGWLYQLYKSETDARSPASGTPFASSRPDKCEHHMNGTIL